MRVSDVMTRNVVSAQPDDTILTAARIMLQNRISGLPVVDAERQSGRNGNGGRFPAAV